MVDREARVLLTFDVDAEALWRTLPNGANRPALLSQGAYGLREGLPRILAMLDALGARATFFVPGEVAADHPAPIREIASRGHEVASHGYSHVPLSFIGSAVEEAEALTKSKNVLEQIIGAEVVGFGAPACDVSVHTIALLAELGFRYDRSFLDADRPYVWADTSPPVIELPVSWVLDDFSFFGHNIIPRLGWGIRSVREVERIWSEELATSGELGYACLVLHPELSGRKARADMLLRLMRTLGGVQFTTCLELADSIGQQVGLPKKSAVPE
ncbi:MAG: polysaccharide deacetylase family protein [Haloechinothrix sp.]